VQSIQSSITKVMSNLSRLLERVPRDLIVAPTDTPFGALRRVFNQRFNASNTPLAVALPRTSKETALLIKVASELEIPVRARSGGHSYTRAIQYKEEVWSSICDSSL